MVEAALSQSVNEAPSPEALCARAYRFMLLARILDDKYASLYRAGKICGGCFLGRGQEAFSVAGAVSLRRGDVFAPLVRDAAGRFAFGEPLLDSVRTYLGSALGPMRGRDGNIHRGHPDEGLLAMISHLGAMISVVNGMLLAGRFQGLAGQVGVASIGDGGTSTGSFHEAVNQAAVERLPLVVMIANNQYAYSTPNTREFGCRNLVDRALGYGVEGHTVDGTDLGECLRVTGEAIRRARAGHGPQIVVGQLLRMCGHGEHDDASYISPALKQSALGRDCVKVAEEQLLQQGVADAATLEGWRSDTLRQIEEAIATVQREAAPDPFEHDWCAIASRHLLETHLAPVAPVAVRGVLDLP
jgi:pyruvate dehydrogenase E1 component alpha subunit/2-oxoisovalerate dehydrogenase E1 component alpha subunit